MAGPRAEPERTCLGCRGKAAKRTLLRVVRRPDGSVHADPSGRAPGRGAYVHRDLDCVAQAVRRGGLARALRAGPGTLEAGTLRSELESEMGVVAQ